MNTNFNKINEKLKFMPPAKIIFWGYICVIFIGAMLLFLPISSKGEYTSFSDAFFTSASAVCVTGLVRFDTYSHWSVFGQAIILLLIQTGGIGFMTAAVWFMTVSSRKIGISQRVVMQNSISAPQLGGIVKMTKFIILSTFTVEAIGAILLSFYFCRNNMGLPKGIWYGIFHSISAFCNAGFDLMGYSGEYISLTEYNGNLYINTVIMLLIITGGLGFFVWKDILTNRFKFSKFRLHSKIVVSVSSILIIFGALFILLAEYKSGAYENLSFGRKILSSLFQSVSARTAGFNTVDLTKYSESGIFLMICLMLIGGSSGSTAGGIKTTTFAVIVLSIFASLRRKKECNIFGRRLESGIFAVVSSIFITYISLICVCAVIISHIEKIPLLYAGFECTSALATVGLSLSVTPSLGFISKMIIICLMIIGRVGSLTVIMAVMSPKEKPFSKFPLEKIQVG